MDLTEHRAARDGVAGADGNTGPAGPSSAIKISDYSTANDGITDATTGVASAIQAAIDNGSYLVNTGAVTDLWLVTSLSNIYGVEFEGAGKILITWDSSVRQLNSSGDRFQNVFGREYLSHFHKRLMAGTASKITFSGDSTTAGDNLTSPYYYNNAIVTMATKYGIVSSITGVNAGHGGFATSNWLSSYITTDLAGNPNLYVVRWGINEGGNVTQFINNIRSGLSTIRASKSLANMSIILMAPNPTSDPQNNRDERYYERIIPGLKQAARDYQCCFFNTYGIWRDAYAGVSGAAADDYMDSPYDAYRHIHPDNVFAMWITSELSDIIFPRMLRVNG